MYTSLRPRLSSSRNASSSGLPARCWLLDGLFVVVSLPNPNFHFSAARAFFLPFPRLPAAHFLSLPPFRALSPPPPASSPPSTSTTLFPESIGGVVKNSPASLPLPSTSPSSSLAAFVISTPPLPSSVRQSHFHARRQRHRHVAPLPKEQERHR